MFSRDTATSYICTLSLHDALPIFLQGGGAAQAAAAMARAESLSIGGLQHLVVTLASGVGIAVAVATPLVMVTIVVVVANALLDRKSTRLNSSHSQISYAVFCLKKK